MATWLENQRDKAKRDAENKRLTKLAVGLDTPSGNPFGRWAQGVAQRTIHPLETLGTVAQESIDDPMATALNWSNPMASSLSGLAGIFAGKGAKTANLAQLLKADKLKAKGVPDELIWKKTGWTLDTPDKLPRFEIPDNGAKLRQFPTVHGDTAFSDNVFDDIYHPELQNAWSGGKYYSKPTLRVTNSVDSPHGAYIDNLDSIVINSNEKNDALSTTLHELQHAIQQREGFARGGSPTEFADEFTANRARLNFLEQDPIVQRVSNEFDRGVNSILDDAPDIATAEARIADFENELTRNYPEFAEIRKVVKELAGKDKTGYKTYQRLAGEAESRLTQARMNLTPEQRLAQYPYQPEYFQKETGVPLKDLIVRTK